MTTTVKFNTNNEKANVTNAEIITSTTNQEIIDYLQAVEKYDAFCRSQTKRGQARKNERARARHKMFATVSISDSSNNELEDLRKSILKEKDDKIAKIEVQIAYDGRKASNLHKIIQGVKMAIFVGGISPQYYGIGLKYFEVK